jgi:chromosome segregation ATPase
VQDANRLSSEVTSLNSDNGAQRQKIEALQKDLDAAKRDLTDSDDQVKEITSQKKALADCLNAFYDATKALDDANGQRTAEVNAKIAEYDRLCDIADRYL